MVPCCMEDLETSMLVSATQQLQVIAGKFLHLRKLSIRLSANVSASALPSG